MSRTLRLLALLLTCLCLPLVAARASGTLPLTIRLADGSAVHFTVELANTPAEDERGLMNRPSLAADAGMLFDFGTEQSIAMWMKNTLIPLDMLFITQDGRISGIAQRAVPLSLETIPSPGPVRGVLEINGGTCERLHIKVGDRVEEPRFSSLP